MGNEYRQGPLAAPHAPQVHALPQRDRRRSARALAFQGPEAVPQFRTCAAGELRRVVRVTAGQGQTLDGDDLRAVVAVVEEVGRDVARLRNDKAFR